MFCFWEANISPITDFDLNREGNSFGKDATKFKNEGAVLENFGEFSKILSNQCTKKALKLHFKAISDGRIFVSGRSKNLKLFQRNQYMNIPIFWNILPDDAFTPIFMTW